VRVVRGRVNYSVVTGEFKAAGKTPPDGPAMRTVRGLWFHSWHGRPACVFRQKTTAGTAVLRNRSGRRLEAVGLTT